MPLIIRGLAILTVLLTGATASGQVWRDLEIEPPPPRLTPRPAAELEKHYQALKLYTRGRFLERDHRLVDALRTYEEALRLAPESPALYKALIPLCFHLDRETQALDYCAKAAALSPNDYELLYRYGCELRERGRTDEAVAVIAQACRVPAARERPQQLVAMMLTLAILCEDLKRYDQAAEAFGQVMAILDGPDPRFGPPGSPQRRQLDADLARLCERLGRAELLAGRHEAAIAAFLKAQKKDPLRAGRLHYNLAEVYIAKDDLNQALDHLVRYIATQPAGTEAYERLIDVLTRLRRQDEIIPALEQAAARDQFNQDLKLLLAGQYVRAGQHRKAEAVYLAALDDNPSEDAYRGLAKLYQQQGRWDELLKRLDADLADPHRVPAAKLQVQVLTADPALVKGIAQTAHARPRQGRELAYSTRRVLATLCRQAKHYDLAEHFCRIALPDDPQPGDVYLELCRVLSEAKRFEAEVAVCREALQKKLVIPPLIFQLELARGLSQLGRDAEAIAAAQDALGLTAPAGEDRFRAAMTLATVYYRAGQLDKSAAECEQLLKAAEDAGQQQQVRYLLAGVYAAQKRYDRAEEQLRKILDLDPDDTSANNDLGYLWAEQGKNLDEAERLIRKAIELDRAARAKRRGALEIPPAEQDNAAYIDSLGWVLFKRGRLHEARQHLERAARLEGGDDPVIWDHLGDVYRALGQPAQARRAWERALELYKTSRRVGLEERHRDVEGKLREVETPLFRGAGSRF
jgi:tetratricopeptide (TPR) repeat protein